MTSRLCFGIENRASASTINASSPSRVLAATHSGRDPKRCLNSLASDSAASGTRTSNFRLPVTTGCAAPSDASRSASAADCAAVPASRRSIGRASAGNLAYALADGSDKRALIKNNGIPASCAFAMRFGQSSVSRRKPTAGRKCDRNPSTAKGRSYGSHAWMTRSPNKARPVSRPVAVMCVSRIVAAG